MPARTLERFLNRPGCVRVRPCVCMHGETPGPPHHLAPPAGRGTLFLISARDWWRGACRWGAPVGVAGRNRRALTDNIIFAPAATTLGGCALRRLTHVFSTTACPHKPGFEVRTDVKWVANAGAVVGNVTAVDGPALFAAAESYCREDAGCTAFNNLGEVIRGGIVGMSTTCFPGVCVYLKQSEYDSLYDINNRPCLFENMHRSNVCA